MRRLLRIPVRLPEALALALLACTSSPEPVSSARVLRDRPPERISLIGTVLELRQSPDGMVAVVGVERVLEGPLHRREVDCLLGPGWWNGPGGEGDRVRVRLRRRMDGTSLEYVTLPWPDGLARPGADIVASEPAPPDPIWVEALLDALRRRDPDADLRREFLHAGSAAVPGLVDLLDEDELAVRWRAARVLSWLPSESALAGLTSLASHPDIRLRLAAAAALRETRTEGARRALVVLARDPDPGVRAIAVGALGRHRDPASTAALLEAISDEDPLVRLEALRALGRVRGEAAARGLAAALEETSRPGPERAEALDALGRTGSPVGVEVFEGLLEEGPLGEGRLAVEGLARLGRHGIPSLLGALEHSDPVVRWRSAESLRRATGKRFGYRHDAAPEERRAAAEAWRRWWRSSGRSGGAG